MKLHEYIEQLTQLMEHHQAQDFEVKTRSICLDRWGGYDGEFLVDLTGDQFCLDTKAKIAFIDCESEDFLDRDELIDRWVKGKYPTT